MPTMQSAIDWMRRRAENVVAGMLGLMFVAFLVQIVFRYVFNFPIGWTSELSVIAWLYMTLLGSAFWLKESEEIRFDILLGMLGPRGRRAARIPRRGRRDRPVRDGAAGYREIRHVHEGRERLVYLKIRLDLLYSVYVVFAIAVIVRYAWAIVSVARGQARRTPDVTKTSSGL